LKKIQYKLVVIFAIGLTLTFVSVALTTPSPPRAMSSQPQAELYVGASANPNVYDPVNITSGYKPGDNFTVYIKVRNITDLWGASLWMNYNCTVLNCTALRFGASWGTFPEDYFFIEGDINRTKGTIEKYDACRTNAVLPTNATLYEVDFRILNLEKSTLHIITGTYDPEQGYVTTELRNSAVEQIDCPITDGYFIPEFPSAMILPLLTIVALAVVLLRKRFQLTKRVGPSPRRN